MSSNPCNYMDYNSGDSNSNTWAACSSLAARSSSSSSSHKYYLSYSEQLREYWTKLKQRDANATDPKFRVHGAQPMRPIGCTPALSVTYSAAAAAVCILWRYISDMPILFLPFSSTVLINEHKWVLACTLEFMCSGVFRITERGSPPPFHILSSYTIPSFFLYSPFH